ncbi:MAG: hypothetical protein ACLQVI_23960 [Polyangiaceae bacterium]
MSARQAKKKEKRNVATPWSRASAREFGVLVEDMKSQFKVFGEAVQAVDEKVDRLDRKVTSGFARVDAEMASGFARVDAEVASGFARVDRELGLVKAVVIDHSRELREIRGSVTRLEAAMEKKVDRDDVEAIAERVVARPRPR